MMTEVKAQTYEGGCHCGQVRFRVTADLSSVTYCNCSISAKKGFLHLNVPPENFELINGPRSDPDKIDVNVRCLDGVDPAALDVKEFDGRNWEHAMAERVPWR